VSGIADMQSFAQEIALPPPPRRIRRAGANRMSAGALWGWWVASLAIVLFTVAAPSVDRSQEARVLETAREMLGRGFHDWMIPRLDGQIRLNKPPLAYWMAAGSFKLFGVSDGAGRLPFALCAWLAVGLTGLFGAELFGRRAGFFAGAALLGGLLFARLGRLAETDILVLLLMTAAVYAFWHAIGSDRAADAPTFPGKWLYLASVAIGLIVLAKGLPALFPVLFLIALAWTANRWDLPWRWVKCGALLAAVAIGAPWFIYVERTVGLHTLIDEARIASVGMYHRAWFFNYFAWLLVAVAPWCAFAAAGIALAIRRWHDPRLRMLLIWSAAVFIPLCFAGQKQKHYLMPMLPAIALLTGWFCDRSLGTRGARAPRGARRDTLLAKAGEALLLGTLLVSAGAALLAPMIGSLGRGYVAGIDWAMAFGAVALMLICLIVYWWRGAGPTAILASVAAAILMAIVTCVWSPTLKRVAPQQIAGAVRAAFPGRACAFYGTIDLPTLWYLRQIAPAADTPADLEALLDRNPQMVVLITDPAGKQLKLVPDGVVVRLTFSGEDKTIRVGERAR
jgi:4-amino-4-deoxy-L-arabinose transferase-like glycosyltransferase